jgi:Carboxypeptidase regulatory-like domain
MKLIVLLSAATLLVAQDAPPGGAVEGIVVNSATGAGIDGASVTFFGGPSGPYHATTDAVGRSKIVAMAAGNYRTQAEKGGFSTSAPGLAAFLSSPGLRIVSGLGTDGPFPSLATLSLLPSRGTSVRVEEGSATSVTPSMVAAPR